MENNPRHKYEVYMIMIWAVSGQRRSEHDIKQLIITTEKGKRPESTW